MGFRSIAGHVAFVELLLAILEFDGKRAVNHQLRGSRRALAVPAKRGRIALVHRGRSGITLLVAQAHGLLA